MHQKPLLEETKEFLEPSEKSKQGIHYHEQYSENIGKILFIMLVGLGVTIYLFGFIPAALFGGFIFIFAIGFELFLRFRYKFDGRTAVIYYALEVYNEPSEESLKQLQSWNKNPFDLTKEYYYPKIGELTTDAFNSESPAKYANEKIPDILRLIERNESKNYNSLVDMESITNYDLPEYYLDLIQELNYTYKFGAYTSTSILIRKVAENLIRDILFSKGIYSELPQEPRFEEKVNLLAETLEGQFDEDTIDTLTSSLNNRIRRKGNKAAHLPEEFTRDEIEELMEHARSSIRLLIVIYAESVDEKPQIDQDDNT